MSIQRVLYKNELWDFFYMMHFMSELGKKKPKVHFYTILVVYSYIKLMNKGLSIFHKNRVRCDTS